MVVLGVFSGVDDVEERDIIEYLVFVVLGVQRSFSGVVIQYGDVGVLIGEGYVRVFVIGRVGEIGKVDFGFGQVGVGYIEYVIDYEGFVRVAFGVVSVLGSYDFEGVRVQSVDYDVVRVLVGGVYGLEFIFIYYEVYVGEVVLRVGEGVVVVGFREVFLYQYRARAEVVFDYYVVLVFVVEQGVVVYYVVRVCLRLRQQVLDKVLVFDEVFQGAEFQDSSVFVIVVYVLDLRERRWLLRDYCR